MKVLLCIVFSIAFPVFMWLFAVSVTSFVRWDNYFVIGFGEWEAAFRFFFILLWFSVVLAFSLQCLLGDNRESKS
jgi:hypothetical protein